MDSTTPEQRLRRAQARVTSADAAHKAARTAGHVPPEVTREAGEARLALRKEQVGPELFAARQAWGAHHIVDRAQRLVSFGEEDKSGHGPMMVVSHAQMAELHETGTIVNPRHESPPKWEG